VQERGVPEYVRETLSPVQDAGLLDVDGTLPDALQFVPLPGHTPGHTGVLLEEALPVLGAHLPGAQWKVGDHDGQPPLG
jgi:glyoxylase-like metal-dependent hydrolase (beta-lactamase superfamily II)